MRGLAVLVASLLACACSSQDSSVVSSASKTDTTEVVVFAAASLNKVFPEIAPATYSFDGSSSLVDQISAGAPADVFASADRRTMDKAVGAGLIDGEPVMFATNHLVLITPANNPGGITGLDTSLEGRKLVTCAPEVPCGAATVKLAEKAGITLHPVSEESKVTDVLGKVSSGEADAGLVYATDAVTAGAAVATFEIPGAAADPNTYWIARVKGTRNASGADAFIARITQEGTAVLAEHGFGPAR
ncbi:molybdate ABC transporter substrate-binding protein [Arachnia propionica]|uniref:Molybdate ABC transporter substrate-binding protein n=1 Tax=Arachnia propionica TaxID=1750 RepID=A0A3P1T4Q6_9ACTN|nr:molybdate ABC transporter substrate-binding protein [Arachnia propionica]RRD03403.1 molybdate ABC transporter substrate-binding protein [Arachnia propionica]